mgnify:CR=1 FL=1
MELQERERIKKREEEKRRQEKTREDNRRQEKRREEKRRQDKTREEKRTQEKTMNNPIIKLVLTNGCLVRVKLTSLQRRLDIISLYTITLIQWSEKERVEEGEDRYLITARRCSRVSYDLREISLKVCFNLATVQ